MKKLLTILLLSTAFISNAQINVKWGKYIAAYISQPVFTSTTNEEFIGPFPSWDNVVTKYGIANDGVTDVTDTLKKLVASIASGKVLYLPNGTYIISGTLSNNGVEGVAIIGEDPLHTIIKWNGAQNSDMINLNGWVYSKINRITFDANGISGVNGINQSFDGNHGTQFDTGNEYADDIFSGCSNGIIGGTRGYGFAETSITRCWFRKCTDGVTVWNSNALDTWITDCRFDTCNNGVGSASGNFHVVNSTFNHCLQYDMSVYNAEGFSVQNSTSIGGRTFFYQGFSENASPILIQNCSILDYTDIAIYIRSQGPVTLLDNNFRNTVGSSHEDCQIYGSTNVPVIAYNNKFNRVSGGGYNNFTAYGPVTNYFVNNSYGVTITDTVPAFQGFAQNYHRQIFEASNSSLQQAIDSAAALNNNAVVHFTSIGTTATINCPANSQYTVMGDGYVGSTIFANSVPDGQVVMKLNGPSLVTLRDFQIKNHPNDYAIEINNADQVGSTFHSYQYEARRPINSSFYYDSLDNLIATLHNSEFLYDGFTSTGLIAKGGALTNAGTVTTGKIIRYNLNGATFGNNIDIKNGATLTDVNWWFEANSFVPPFANLKGKGNYALAGARVHSNVLRNGDGTHVDSSNFTLRDFNGKVTLLSANITDWLRFKGSGSNMKFLALGCYLQDTSIVSNTTSPAGDIRILYNNTSKPQGDGSIAGYYSEMAPNYGTVDNTFVTDMLSQIRNIPVPKIPAKTTGVTSVYVSHVWAEGDGIHIKK